MRLRSAAGMRLANGFATGGNAAADADVANLRFAEIMPVIAGLGVDAAGTLWIARTGSTAFAPGPIDLVQRDANGVEFVQVAKVTLR